MSCRSSFQPRPASTTQGESLPVEPPAALVRIWYICTARPAATTGIDAREARFEDLTAAALAVFLPAIVVMPLANDRVDSLQILKQLQRFGFGGRCFVLCPDLPSPALVAAEIQAEFPQMQIDLLPPGAALPIQGLGRSR